MVTEQDVFAMMEELNIPRDAYVTVHSSLRSIGEIQGGADGLIDAFSKYLNDGLLLIPTHTWGIVNMKNPRFDARETGTNLGILSSVALKHPGGIRSLHPTHSMVGFGKDAEKYLKGEEKSKTPAPVGGALSRLGEIGGYVLLLGVGMESNTFLHAVDEMAEQDWKLSKTPYRVTIFDREGHRSQIDEFCGHGKTGSRNFGNYELPFYKTGAIRYGKLGNAKVICGDCSKMSEAMLRILERADYDVLESGAVITEDLYLE